MSRPMVWNRRNRIIAVTGLLCLLAFGFWSLRFMLIDDMPRMELWQRFLFWIGDAGAVFYAINWMLKDDEPAVSPNRNSKSAFNVAFWLVVFSVVVDIALTVFLMYTTSQALARSVACDATVTSSVAYKLENGLASHYRLNVEYTDSTGKTWNGVVKCAAKTNERIADWKLDAIDIVENQLEDSKIEVVYDPEFPIRVWIKGHPWAETAGIDGLIAVIHIFQCVSLMFWNENMAGGISQSSLLPLIPLLAEAVMLSVFGWVLHQV